MTEAEQDQEILRLRQDLRDLTDALTHTQAVIDGLLTVMKSVAVEITELKKGRATAPPRVEVFDSLEPKGE